MLIWHGDGVLRKMEKDSADVKAQIANAIADRAKFLCPVKSGALRASISAGAEIVEVTEDYAGLVEFGTATRAAKPFVRPAIEQVQETDIL